MPFKSYRQQKYMFAKHPEVAKKWAKKYGTKKKPKGYRAGLKIREGDLSSHTDPIAKKALKQIYKH